jgi:hypothetical protein
MDKDPATIEELTAYLDGELEPAAASRVEERLGSDPEYRAEMQSLQKTWDLFDSLPIAQTGVSFTKTTMELVVGDAMKRRKKSENSWWTWPLRIGVLTGLPLVLFAASFFVTRRVQMQPNLQLVSNVFVIENYDRYEKVNKSIDFLVALNQQGLFANDELPDYGTGASLISADFFDETFAAPSSPTWESIEERINWIDSLDIEQKSELRRKSEEFFKLSSERQAEFRDFHQKLANHPDRVQLIQVMNSFYNWLKTLGLSEQARLLDMTETKDRLNEIASIRSRQAREAFGKVGATALPTARDAETLYDWYELTISSKEKEIRSRFAGIVADYFHQNNISFRRSDLERFAYRRPVKQLVGILIGVNRSVIEDLMLENVDLLRSALSFEARTILDEQSPDEQKELIFNWFEVANETKSSISAERLQEFYEQLPLADRDKLDKMDPETWYRTLEERYRAENRNSRLRTSFGGEQDWNSLFNLFDREGF